MHSAAPSLGQWLVIMGTAAVGGLVVGVLVNRLKEQAALDKIKAEAKAKAEIAQVRKEGAAAIEKAKQEAALKETAVRDEALKAATAAMAPKLAEANQARKAAEKLAKEQREDARERSPHDQHGGDRARGRAIEPLHKG